jgi:hypothetical protein
VAISTSSSTISSFFKGQFFEGDNREIVGAFIVSSSYYPRRIDFSGISLEAPEI